MLPSHASDSDLDKPTHSPESPLHDDESPLQPSSELVSSPHKSDDSKSTGESEVKEECGVTVAAKRDGTVEEKTSGRERLKRHRIEVAGRVWIPDMWGQEDLLKDWIDCAAFDAPLVNSRILLARDSLMGEGRRSANPTTLRLHHGC